MSKLAVMTLALATVLNGSAGAQDPLAVEVGDPGEGDTEQSAEPTSTLGADSTKEAGGADHHKSAVAVRDSRARPARKLTAQQKRMFVLGLWAGEKN